MEHRIVITWNGGTCPVPAGTRVNVLHRDGTQHLDVEALWPGKAFKWEHEMMANDIMAYEVVQEYTGFSVSYYRVHIENPTSPGVAPYDAECNDIIEALGMNYAEGNAFKAIWRSCAARNLGMSKSGYKDGLYDAEKVVFFGQRMVVQAR